MTIFEALEARGISSEVAAKYGLGDGGSALIIPFNREGREVRRKYRTLTGEKKFWADKGGESCAWNEDCLRDDSLIDQPLVITEGELDAISAIQAGYLRTISVPDGAPKEATSEAADSRRYEWLQPIRDLLRKDRVKEIILATDNDGPGHALQQDLSILLGRFRCKFLVYPLKGERRLKDLNEVLQAYGAEGVVKTLQRAQFIKVDGVFKLSELPPLPSPVSYDIGFDLLRDNYKMRLGDFAVVTGTPGFGKSSFVNDVCCRVSWAYRARVAWASFEQAPQRDHRRNLRCWYNERHEHNQASDEIARADAWIEEFHRFVVPNEDDDVTLEWLLDRLEIAVVQHGVKIVVIDPWNEMDHARAKDESLTEYTGRAIKTLKRFARTFQVHLIVVAHPAKMKKVDGKYLPPTLYDISDSAHWYNKPEIGIIVHRETEDETVIKVQKSRYHDQIGKPGEVEMQYCVETRRYSETRRLA